MADYTNEALGEVVRRHRLRRKLTQEELGRAAGYSAGAGVAVSRIETGQINVREGRLEQLADSLGVSAARLVKEAVAETDARQERDSTGESAHLAPLKERLEQAEHRILLRMEAVEHLAGSVNAHQVQAQDSFVLPFIEVARQITDTPTIDFPDLGANEESSGDEQAQQRVDLAKASVSHLLAGGAAGAAAGAGVGGAAAFATFSLAAAYGTASTGTAITALAGVAASNATLAFLGGGSLAAGGLGIAGGTAILGGIVAAPIALLAVGGGALWYRKKRKEAEERVTQVQTELDATQDRYEAVLTMLRGSDTVLHDIALFASRSFDKWHTSLPRQRPLTWHDLNQDQQQAYDGFITIMACYLSVASLNPEGLMDVSTPLEDLVAKSNAVLSDSSQTVSDLV